MEDRACRAKPSLKLTLLVRLGKFLAEVRLLRRFWKAMLWAPIRWISVALEELPAS
jgi:hypothetical protein